LEDWRESPRRAEEDSGEKVGFAGGTGGVSEAHLRDKGGGRRSRRKFEGVELQEEGWRVEKGEGRGWRRVD